jgi:hypothetical protein
MRKEFPESRGAIIIMKKNDISPICNIFSHQARII